MWRPENWLVKQLDWVGVPESYEGFCSNVKRIEDYEAGADAMLEALKEIGVFTYGNHTPDINLNDAPEVSGYWCFIPEE